MLFNRTNLNNLTGIYWHIIKQHRQQQQQPQYQKQPSTTIFNEREGETKSSFQLPTYHSNIKLQLFEQTTNHDARTARKFFLKKMLMILIIDWNDRISILFDSIHRFWYPSQVDLVRHEIFTSACCEFHGDIPEELWKQYLCMRTTTFQHSDTILTYICPLSLQSVFHS